MCDQVPGLLTKTMPAIGRPRKTSRETRRLLCSAIRRNSPQIRVSTTRVSGWDKADVHFKQADTWTHLLTQVVLTQLSLGPRRAGRDGPRPQTKLLRIWQNRSRFISSHRFIHLAALT